jgi:hypothetical protein
MRRLHDVGLKTQDQNVLAIERASRSHPLPIFGEQLSRQSGQQILRGQEGGFLLDDAMDDKIADAEFEAHVFSR